MEIDPELSEAERKEIQVEIRNLLDGISAESSIDYGVISLDLLSHDIDSRTLDNVALLVGLAMLVVVISVSYTHLTLPTNREV